MTRCAPDIDVGCAERAMLTLSAVMARWRRGVLRAERDRDLTVFLFGLALFFLLVSAVKAASDGTPTVEQYAAHVGGRIVPAGELVLDGSRLVCGRRPTVLDNTLDDYGAAYPGFLILNPKLIARVPKAVKMWIYSHECGHQFRGPDEEVADCFAVQRGRRQRWLTTDGLAQICKFIGPAKGSSMHYSGPHRCRVMRQCFVERRVR